MDIDNPLLSKAHQSERAQHLPSTNVVSLERPKKRISAKTERLIGELGLRHRPSAQADLDEHAALLALLARDVADLPPDLLERAISDWVRKSHFMPKASDLVALCQSYVAQPRGNGAKVDLVERYNARLRAEGKFSMEWFEDEVGDMKLRPRN